MERKLRAAAKTRQDKRTMEHIINIKNGLNELPMHLDDEGKKIYEQIIREVAKI